jgi:hypothetical protein
MSTEDARVDLENEQARFKELQAQQKTGRNENMKAVTAEMRKPPPRQTADTPRRTFDESSVLLGKNSAKVQDRRSWDYTVEEHEKRQSAR